MVMNNICFSNVMATAAPQQQCHIWRCEVVDSKNQQNLLNELLLLWTTSSKSLHTPECIWCKVQFVDVSRTWKHYTRHKQLWTF